MKSITILRTVGIAIVLAATVVSSASAMRSADGSAGPVSGVSATRADTSDAISRYLNSHRLQAPIPYLSQGVGVDPAQFGGTGVPQPTRPDDRAGVRTTVPSQPAPVASTDSGGFNWGDAGIGAGAALALFLLMTVGTSVAGRGRKPTVAIS